MEPARLLHVAGLRVRSVWRTLFGRRALERDIEDELETHLDYLTVQYVARGLAPEVARRDAARAMDGVVRQREAMRDALGVRVIDDFVRDVRYAAASLRRTPGFTLVAALTLALGLAASTTMFGLVYAAMFRAPPFPDAERLVLLNIVQRTPGGPEQRVRWSWPRYRLLEANVHAYDAIATTYNTTLTMARADFAEPLQTEIVSSRYLAVMRTPLVLGRDFTSDDDTENATLPAVILAHDTWQDRFGGSADVIGKLAALNGVTFTVIGVTAPGFHGVSGIARAFIPAGSAARTYFPQFQTIDENFLTVVGRLRAGVPFTQARAELAVIGQRVQSAYPPDPDTPLDLFAAAPIALNDARLDARTARGLRLLAGATLALLLVACVNVASLLLGRTATRRREIAIRLTLGASRSRLVRQLLTESGLLAAMAGVIGAMVGMWAAVVIDIPPTLTRGRAFNGVVGEFSTPALDWRIACFTAVLAGCTVVLFGLVPALQATRADTADDLKGSVSTAGRRRSTYWTGIGLGLREFAVAMQLALSVLLLMGCGLLLTSYARLQDTQLGFDSSRLLTFMLRPSEARYPAPAAPALIARVLTEIERVPGVRGVTVDGCAPLTVQCASAALYIVGRPWAASSDAPIVLRHYVAPSHFRTLGIGITRGRSLTDDDRAGHPHVVVINEAAASRYWPGENPIGKRVWFDGAAAFGSADSSAEVVGVARNVAYQPLDGGPVQPDFFTSYAQFTYASRMVIVRATGDPEAIVSSVGAAVRRVDSGLALFDVMTMDARISQSWARQRFQTGLLSLIATIALVLAVAGVYAVTAYAVTSRRREIGVRMALGASALHVVGTSIGATARLALIGGVLGIVGALALSRFVTSLLYETSPVEPRVMIAVAAILAAVVALASVVPVRRALRVDPATTLREG